MHQPSFALERRRRVGVQGLVTVKENVALVVEELQRVQFYARKFGFLGELGIGPAL